MTRCTTVCAGILVLAAATFAEAQTRHTAPLAPMPDQPTQSRVPVRSLNLPPRVTTDTIQFTVESSDGTPMPFVLAIGRGVADSKGVCGFDAPISTCRVASSAVPDDADVIVATTGPTAGRWTLVATIQHQAVALGSEAPFAIGFPQDVVELTTTAGNTPLLLDVVANTDGILFGVRVLDADNNLIAASHISAPQQTILLRTVPARLLVEFNRLDSGARAAASMQVSARRFDEHDVGGTARRYRVDRANAQLSRSANRDRWPTPAEGLAFRWAIDDAEYVQLRDLASQCGPLTRDTQACQKAVQQTLRFAADATALPAQVLDDEPIVVFVGIAGENAVLGLRPGHPHDALRKTVLDAARNFWTLYIEDDGVPYETSVDIEFKPRASDSDFEEFDPSTIGRGRSVMPGGANVRHTVKIGIKRFAVRRPPTAIEVAFTRQGGTYGLRQWRRSFRVLGWHWLSIGAGLFVSAVPEHVDTHELVAFTLPDGSFSPNGVITQEQSLRPVFLTMDAGWPAIQSHVIEKGSLLHHSGLSYVPNLKLGVGLPPSRFNAYFIGGSWPVAFDWLHFVLGYTLTEQEHFVGDGPGFRVGDRLPLGTSLDDRVTHDMVWTPTLGVYFNLTRFF